MGLFAPVAAYLAAKIGTRRAMTIGLALIGVFGILRAAMPSAWLVVLLTWPVGIGMGLGNALAPISVKEHFESGRRRVPACTRRASRSARRAPQRSPSRSPLARRLARRADRDLVRRAASLVAWVVLTWRDAPHAAPAATVPRLPWRSRTAWLLVAIFAPDGLRLLRAQRLAPGRVHRTRLERRRSAGLLLAMMNLTAIPSSFVIPWLSDRTGGAAPSCSG